MPPETNDIHAKLGNHEAQLASHRRELDGLWDKDDNREKELTKVRIQMAVILAVGGAFVVLVQAVATKFTIEAITRAMGGN
jgi:hypothetical protein